MKKTTGFILIALAALDLVISVLSCHTIANIYQEKDSESIAQALKDYQVSVESLQKICTNLDEKVIPQIIQVTKSTHVLVHSLKGPADFLYKVTDFSMFGKRPFEDFQESVRIFQQKTRPDAEKALANTILVGEDFQKNHVPNIRQSLKSTSLALYHMEGVMKKHATMNKQVAIFVLLIGTSFAAALFLLGYHFISDKKQQA